jgi:hypothetical protein
VTARGCTTEPTANQQQRQLVFSAPNAMNMSNKTKITACFLLWRQQQSCSGRTRKIDDNERSFAATDSFLVAIARSIILIFLLFVGAFYIEDDVSKVEELY